MLENYTVESLRNEILDDCKFLLDYCCNIDIANALRSKYSELRINFMEFGTLSGIELALRCQEMLIALDRVIRHGDIENCNHSVTFIG